MKKLVLIASLMLVVLLAACQTAVATTPAPVVETTEAPVEETIAPVAAASALTVTGKVAVPQGFTMDDLNAMNVIITTVTHPKNGDLEVTGVLLKDVLDLAQPAADATKIVFTASDGYATELDLATVTACANCMIGFADDGTLTTAMPGFEGSSWAKMLVSIEIK